MLNQNVIKCLNLQNETKLIFVFDRRYDVRTKYAVKQTIKYTLNNATNIRYMQSNIMIGYPMHQKCDILLLTENCPDLNIKFINIQIHYEFNRNYQTFCFDICIAMFLDTP